MSSTGMAPVRPRPPIAVRRYSASHNRAYARAAERRAQDRADLARVSSSGTLFHLEGKVLQLSLALDP